MMNFLTRVVSLFFAGVLFSLVLNLLQFQRQITIFPDLVDNVFSSTWWVPPSCGFAAALLGMFYPYTDRHFGLFNEKQEWSGVMRCVAVFVGINQASAKIDFSNSLQFSLTLLIMSFGLWWLFDKSMVGLLLGVLFSFVATFMTQLLVYWELFKYSNPDFVFVRSWLPCIFFSASVTMGLIGRQLALYDETFLKNKCRLTKKYHME
ncbi:hypothetical protein HELRODRAFT_102315 [Helobdella robusta]|uniref:Insulin-induced gene 1 protein n=1 Tax=Helobdella robusta TaxID=6412 RepID=T1ED94_HELRO|nr:hypothetical protein HELRODRAFT_102315 [Helobdella robusta]ESN96896.1 hypothetical protein HELRODRAFT_102315 [Helobdella robusta]